MRHVAKTTIFLLLILLFIMSVPSLAQGPGNNIQLIANFTGIEARGVYAHNGVLYIADMLDGRGLRILDNRDHQTLSDLGAMTLPGNAIGVYGTGNTTYIADDSAGLRLIDTSDLHQPAEKSNFIAPGNAFGIYLVGNIAYLANSTDGLRLIDTSVFTNPVEIGHYSTTGYVEDVFVQGTLAYIVDRNGMQILDVADPNNISRIGSYSTPSTANGVVVNQNIAYVSDGWGGMRIVDVSDPTSPSELGVYDAPGWVNDVYIVNNIAYVADGLDGVRVVDVSDASTPVELGFYELPGDAGDIFVENDMIYVADGVGGLFALRYTGEYLTHYLDDFSTYAPRLPPTGWLLRGATAITPTVESVGGSGSNYQLVSFPEVSSQYWDKWLIKDNLILSPPYSVTVKLNFQNSVADRAGLTIAWDDSNWDRIDIQPNVYFDNIEFRVRYSGPITSNLAITRANSIPINAFTDYWLKAVASNYGSGQGQVIVYWSTDSITFRPIVTATGLANLTGLSGIGTAGPHLPHTYFDDFSVETKSVPISYTVSGHIVDNTSHSISEVTVSNNVGSIATSDNNGNYAMQGLDAGSYIITPTKSGYIFSPPSRTISLPPNATGVDFVGSPVSVGRLPLIFIPGISGSELYDISTDEKLWPKLPLSDKLSLFTVDNPSGTIYATDAIRKFYIKFYEPLLSELGKYYAERSAGYWLFPCETPPSDGTPPLYIFPYDWRKDNADSAAQLKDAITCIRQYFPNQPVDILAHSMGGLVARRYILDNPDHHVSKLITVGTPWLGAPKAINAMETGDFFDKWLLDQTNHNKMKYLAGSFTGAHQLLPSQAYFDLATVRPFGEDGWDRDGDGISQEIYPYGNYINELNKFYGKDKNNYFQFRPGDATFSFHDYSNARQDDWRDGGTGVSYYHFYGIESRPDTIGAVLLKSKTICNWFSCDTKYYDELRMVPGDHTVPEVSARRQSNGLDYNDPEAIIWEVRSISKQQDKYARHLEMTQNTNVQRQILRTLGVSESELPAADPSQPTPLLPTSRVSASEANPAHYLSILGSGLVTVVDDAGNSSIVISGTETLQGDVPGVTNYVLGDSAEMVILDPTGNYTVSFQTLDSPMAIELETGIGEAITSAVRYQDLSLPANANTEMRFTPSGVEPLKYDSSGDGTPDTVVTPTVSVSGTAAVDVDPPVISVNVVKQKTIASVTITATDNASGVKDIHYSLDGVAFQVYTGTLNIDSSQTPMLYAFADDNVANRSGLVEYFLGSYVYLPLVLK